MRSLLAILLLTLQSQAWILSGQVLDAGDRAPIPGVSCRVLNSLRGSATDLQGYFRIDVGQRDSLQLRITCVGYASRALSCVTGQPALGIILLKAKSLRAEDLVYSAELKERTAQHASTKVNIVRLADTSENRRQDLTHVLETVPGVSIKHSDGATTNSLSIRGSSNLLGGGVGNRVLLLVDGKPYLSADTGGADWSSIPMSLVERVEVVKGSGSALYGSSAMGGVINLVTRRHYPLGSLELDMGLGQEELPPESQRFRDSRTLEHHLNLNWFDHLGPADYYISTGRRASTGHRQNSDYTLQHLSTRVRFDRPEKASRMELSLGVSMVDRGFPHSWDSRANPLNISSHHPEWLNDRQQKRSLSTEFSWQKTGRKYRIQALSWINASLSETLYSDPDIRDTYSRADNSGLRITGTRRWRLSHDLTGGLELQQDRVNGQPVELFYGKHSAQTQAIFGQDEWTLPAPASLENFMAAPVLTTGLRLDRRHIPARGSETQFSPRIGVNVPGQGRLQGFVFRFTAGRAFRFPSIADLYLKSVPGNDYRFVANPDLRAEQSTSWETGLNWRPAANCQLDFSRFSYDYKDMIHYRDTQDVSVFEIVNLQRALISGWELEGQFHLKDLNWVLSYTYLKTRNRDTGKVLPYQPAHQFFSELSWHRPHYSISTNLRRVSRTEEVRFYPTDSPAGYMLLGASASATLNKTRLTLSAENLGAARYEEMERYRLPGRVWRLTVRSRFKLH